MSDHPLRLDQVEISDEAQRARAYDDATRAAARVVATYMGRSAKYFRELAALLDLEADLLEGKPRKETGPHGAGPQRSRLAKDRLEHREEEMVRRNPPV